MNKTIMNSLNKIIKERGIPLTATIGTDVLNKKAPEGFRPADYFPEAKSMLILARPLPGAVYTTENDKKKYFHAAAATASYKFFDQVTGSLAAVLEEAGYPAVPIPSYSPLRFHRCEPRGLISFKHCAAEAGLGTIGRNTLLINPRYGNILRMGGLLTTAELPPVKQQPLKKVCPDACTLCQDACPVGALKDGGININRCMTKCIDHTLMLPNFVFSFMKLIGGRSRWLNTYIELLTISFFGEYGVKCMACLTACPHFPGKKIKKGKGATKGT